MTDLFLLSRVQMGRIERDFPLSHGIARVDDRRIVSAIVFVIKNGLRWRDAPRDYGPHKTIYNRFVRWSAQGVRQTVFETLAAAGGPPATVLLHEEFGRCYGHRRRVGQRSSMKHSGQSER